jgi:integrase/recombinase XerD
MVRKMQESFMEEQVRAFLTNLEHQSAYSPNTCLAYDNDLHRFVDHLQKTLLRPPDLADFNPRQVAGFLQMEQLAGRRPSTILRRQASFRRFARFLRQQYPERTISFEPTFDLYNTVDGQVEPIPRMQVLSPAQVNTLYATLEASQSPRARRDQAILALLLESGLTVAALTDLDLQHIDQKGKKLRLRTKTGVDIWISLGKAAAAIQRYLREGRLELNYLADEPALFISQTGRRMSRQGVWQVLRQWGYRAGLPVTLSPRLVRHTAALRMVKAGRSLDEIQTLLWHTTPLSTQALLRRLSAAQGE